MWTGIAALSNIDQSLQTIRNDVVRLDNQLAQLTNSLAANQRRRVMLINDIAAVRLAELKSGQLSASLTSADKQAATILTERDAVLEKVNDQIKTIDRQLLVAEDERANLLEQLNLSSQKLVDIEASVQGRLKLDSAYLAQLEASRTAASVSAEAERKVAQAQTDMAIKAKPYQNDPLFMYLWDRRFGTADYHGGVFTRFMDSWVAKLINYEPARVDFWNLTEIPKRLAEHADRVAEAADDSHMALQQIELDALEAAGAKALKGEAEESRAELDRQDDELESIEERLNESLERRAQFMAGEDEYIKRCINGLAQALEHQDLQAVNRYVMATSSPTDDRLVIELQGVDDSLEDVAEDLADVRVLHDNKLDRLKELESVRRNFKNSRYDDVRSGFGNQALIASVLGQFLQGVVSGADVWRVIKRNQRYRNVGSTPDFGSGSLGGIGDLLGSGSILDGARRSRRPRQQRRSTWNWPQPRRGGGGFRIPRGGGFKTGGGF